MVSAKQPLETAAASALHSRCSLYGIGQSEPRKKLSSKSCRGIMPTLCDVAVRPSFK